MAEYIHSAEWRARRAAAMRRYRATEKGKIQTEKAEQKRLAIPRTDEVRAREAAYAREYRKTDEGQAHRKRADKRYAAKVKQHRVENYDEVRAKERAFERQLRARDPAAFRSNAATRIARWRLKNPERAKQIQADFKATPKGRLQQWSGASLTNIRNRKRSDGRPNPPRGGISILAKDLRDLWYAQEGRCPLTGRELKMFPGKTDLCSPSVDRIEPDKGYHVGNVRIVTLQANAAKLHGTDEQLIAFCRDLLRHSDPDLVGFCRAVLEETQ